MKKTILFLAVFGLAAVVLAQLPTSQQSAAPTSNSFRITVMEPQEGATIQGPDFNIVLGLPRTTPPGTAVSPEERRASLTPTYQIWVDGKNYGNLPIGQNVLNVAGVPTGPHKIVIAAKNTAGELIDRKEFSVTTTEPMVAQAQPTQMTRGTRAGSGARLCAAARRGGRSRAGSSGADRERLFRTPRRFIPWSQSRDFYSSVPASLSVSSRNSANPKDEDRPQAGRSFFSSGRSLLSSPCLTTSAARVGLSGLRRSSGRSRSRGRG